MTLHEAIAKLLRLVGRPLTTREIASELNRLQWYHKRDGSEITAFQIHGRTKNYPHLFVRDGSTVSLRTSSSSPLSAPPPISTSPVVVTQPPPVPIDLAAIANTLLASASFKPAFTIDDLVPDHAGLYCIRIREVDKLPPPFKKALRDRDHNIIYIGIATESLKRRFLHQELRANGHGTFFRSIGAVLGFRPPKGSLVGRANTRNYIFAPDDECQIIQWINDNLLVNWVIFGGDCETVETALIQQYQPLINLAKNPKASSLLTRLRAECVKIANEV